MVLNVMERSAFNKYTISVGITPRCVPDDVPKNVVPLYSILPAAAVVRFVPDVNVIGAREVVPASAVNFVEVIPLILSTVATLV